MKSFSSNPAMRMYEYQEFLLDNGYTKEDLKDMSMKEMARAIDEIVPVMVTQVSMTTAGGISKRVTKKVA